MFNHNPSSFFSCPQKKKKKPSHTFTPWEAIVLGGEAS